MTHNLKESIAIFDDNEIIEFANYQFYKMFKKSIHELCKDDDLVYTKRETSFRKICQNIKNWWTCKNSIDKNGDYTKLLRMKYQQHQLIEGKILK